MFKEVWISWKFAKDPLGKAEEMVVWNHSRICMWKSSCDGSKKELREILKE